MRETLGVNPLRSLLVCAHRADMMHVTYGEKAHFLSDDAAETLMEYASALSNADRSDLVALAAVDDHGNAVEATFLLTPSTEMLMESSSSAMRAPENEAAISSMRAKISQLLNPPEIQPEDHAPDDDGDRPGSE